MQPCVVDQEVGNAEANRRVGGKGEMVGIGLRREAGAWRQDG